MTEARLLDSLLRRNAEFVFRHSRGIVIFFTLLTAFAGWFAWENLEIKTSSQDLIGREHHALVRAQKFADEFRKEEDFVVLVESDSPERSIEAIEWLAEQIRSDADLIRENGANLFYKMDQSSMRERALLYLPIAELEALRARLEQAAPLFVSGDDAFTLEGLLQPVGAALNPEALESGSGEGAFGQLGLVTRILAQMQLALEGETPEPDAALLFGDTLSERQESPYFSHEEGRSLILMLNPKGGEESFTPHSATIAKLRSILDAARLQFPDVSFGLTGQPVLSNDEQQTYQRDTTIALLVTIAVVFFSFAYAYRQVVRPLLKIAVLLASLVLALAFTAATVGHLNMLSVAFVVMIMGLGDDFAIYMITRYEEERTHGHAPAEALSRSMVQAGHAVMMAALTTATAFGSMIFTGFLGLVEMGIIAGSGLLICAVLCLTLLPALLLRQRREAAGHRHEIRHRILPLLLRAERAWLRRAGFVVAAALVVVIAAGLAIVHWREIPAAITEYRAGAGLQKTFSRVFAAGFDYDLLDLQNQRLESVSTARKLMRLQPIYVGAVTVDSLDEVLPLQEELASQPSVSRTVSILGSTDNGSSLPADQEVKLPLVRAIQQTAAKLRIQPAAEVNAVRLAAALRGLGEGAGELEELIEGEEETAVTLRTIAASAEVIASRLSDSEAETQLGACQHQLGKSLQESVQFLAGQNADAPMTIADLPEAFRERYVGVTGKLLIEVFPQEDLSVKANLERFNAEVLAIAPHATGAPIDLNIFVDLLRISYVKAALYALGFITILVLLYFRSLLPTALCLIPLAGGILVLVALMEPLGLAFNLANIITLPLILGIGVDNGILIVERFRHEPDIELFSRNTGRAILMSNLTTIAGFVALGLAKHQGIASLGKVMALGVAATMVISLVVLPAVIRLIKKRGIAM